MSSRRTTEVLPFLFSSSKLTLPLKARGLILSTCITLPLLFLPRLTQKFIEVRHRVKRTLQEREASALDDTLRMLERGDMEGKCFANVIFW